MSYSNQIEPTPKQAEFITSASRYSCFSGGFGCVAGETKIYNPHTNTHSRIDELLELNVLSYHIEDGLFHRARAIACPRRYDKESLYRVVAGKHEILVTQKHRFYSKGWKELSELIVGDKILCSNDLRNPSYESILSIDYGRTDYYYDLHVPGYNNYVANGFINHNSGKTYSGCLRSLLLSQFPNNFGLIGRNTYVELRDTTRRTFFEICPPEYYDEAHGGQWKPSENHLKLVNGSEIIFRHLDTISEKELLSLNLGWFFIDQAEEIGGQVWQILQSRLRLNTVPNRYGFIACNPEPGSWIDNTFRKPILEGRRENPDDQFHMIDSKMTDNPYLPKDYVQSIIDNYPEEMRKRYVEGRWDVFENQIYSEYDYNIHCITPFDIPKDWERIVAVDHGMVNPTACLLAALDYDGNVFIYDEYYSPGIVSDHARAILAKTQGQEISLWLIDPSTQAKTREKDGQMWSVMEEYQDYGLYFTPANNEKLAGINRVKEFLKPQKNRRHPITREIPSPKLFIFKNCVNLISEMPAYQWRKLRSLQSRNSPEQPRDFNDHALDSLRYIIMSRFPAPLKRGTGDSLILPEDRKNMNIITVSGNQYQDDELGSYHGGAGAMNTMEDLNEIF